MEVHCENKGIRIYSMTAKSAIIARELGLQVGGAGYDFEGNWRDKGLFAYHTGKYAGCAYFELEALLKKNSNKRAGKTNIAFGKSTTPTCQIRFVKSG